MSSIKKIQTHAPSPGSLVYILPEFRGLSESAAHFPSSVAAPAPASASLLASASLSFWGRHMGALADT